MAPPSATFVALAAEGIEGRVQIAAVAVTLGMFLVVLELVRRRRLIERYALLWMVVAAILLVLAIWTDLLSWATNLVGIEVPANGLFIAAFGVAFLLLLHFSVATSRLAEETKILAQEVARLDAELRSGTAAGLGPAEKPQGEGPVGGEPGPQ
ncbi:MAG: DUF2304 domain-containing protein [bacterium]